MVRKNSLSAVLLLVLLGLYTGCGEMGNDLGPDDSAYFPLQVGDYRVYQVTQENYVAVNSAVRKTYQVQEKISSSSNQNGQVVYLIEESVRQTGQSPWKLNRIYTVYKNPAEVVSQENNLPVVKLAFPIRTTTAWNQNSYNANPDTLLQYQDTGRLFAVGTRRFENTVSVVGSNDSTLVSQKKYLRVYAPNIGLVYREDRSLAFCQSSPACIGQGITESGTKLTWELVAGNRLP
ncbi:hypothetical protein [Spirosoma spitsbergense]|uniref:hypothetical protein n=1 Tax=Spirosoma spitsbergense TaxID=431554 RepID=UPI00036BAB54|nr:hypothetical protein [Spirosoma spitsbergense]